MFRHADIQYDRFIRTTEPQHEEMVSWVWRRLVERGHIYIGEHEGWYSIPDETFLTPIQVITNEEGTKV